MPTSVLRAKALPAVRIPIVHGVTAYRVLRFGCKIAEVRYTEGKGWKYYPLNFGKKPSRNFWPTAEQACARRLEVEFMVIPVITEAAHPDLASAERDTTLASSTEKRRSP